MFTSYLIKVSNVMGCACRSPSSGVYAAHSGFGGTTIVVSFVAHKLGDRGRRKVRLAGGNVCFPLLALRRTGVGCLVHGFVVRRRRFLPTRRASTRFSLYHLSDCVATRVLHICIYIHICVHKHTPTPARTHARILYL